MSRHWVEVVVNESPQRPRSFPATAWLNREAVSFRPWTEFLLDVYGVEATDPAANPLRSGPGDEFPRIGSSDGLSLRVVAVQGSWLRVEDADADETDLPSGWIRWRDGDRLTIKYFLLS